MSDERIKISALDPAESIDNSDLMEVSEPQDNGTSYESKSISIAQLKQYVFQQAFPVGSIYMTVGNPNDVNPGEMFGGQWERFAQGKMIVGVDTDTSAGQNYIETWGSPGLTGGNKTVTLDNENTPQHNHKVTSLKTLLDMGAVEFGIRHPYKGSGNPDPSVKMKQKFGSVTKPSNDVQHTWASGTVLKNQPSTSQNQPSDDQKGDKVTINMPGITTDIDIGNSGGTSQQAAKPFSIMPPYVTCYMWVKTSNTQGN